MKVYTRTHDQWWATAMVVSIALLVGALFLLFGCAPIQGSANEPAAKAAATQAKQGVQDVRAGVSAATANASAIGSGVQQDVTQGRAATPEDGKAALSPIWDDLWAKGTALLNEASTLLNLGGKVETLSASVDTLVSTNTALVTEVKVANAAAEAAKAQAAKANSQTARLTALLYVAALAGIGAFVFLGFLTKNFTIAFAGVAGCGTILIATSLFGRFDAAIGDLFDWAFILIGVFAAFYIADVLLRHFKDGLGWGPAVIKAATTNPVQDIVDAIADFDAPSPKPAAGAATPASA
jgi:outer membrane murein-binding lipoprotein Lpp